MIDIFTIVRAWKKLDAATALEKAMPRYDELGSDDKTRVNTLLYECYQTIETGKAQQSIGELAKQMDSAATCLISKELDPLVPHLMSRMKNLYDVDKEPAGKTKSIVMQQGLSALQDELKMALEAFDFKIPARKAVVRH